jgi:hypothetical protein
MLIYWFQFYPIVCQSLGEPSKRYPQERDNTVQKAQVVATKHTEKQTGRMKPAGKVALPQMKDANEPECINNAAHCMS